MTARDDLLGGLRLDPHARAFGEHAAGNEVAARDERAELEYTEYFLCLVDSQRLIPCTRAGRWGDNRSAAFGELSEYHLCELHTVDVEERRRQWGGELASEADLREVFAKYVEGAKSRLPWCCRLDEETVHVVRELAQLSRNGLLTINSQPRVNGAPSTDPVYGWGSPGGYVFQKAYVEFFCSPAHLQAVRAVVAGRPRVQYAAVNRRGELETSADSKVAPALT